ncbi:putative membrane protein [Clostridium bornimense]|uniref:Putative membrane protein n=1 Tax=Clostridium bornimense TaxID=1216932 RepID=W6S0P1_9CLOT|nr:hypothetical protein [Clostridium bornimense]CDM70328.1 putative membrane protein [Clostridium bornimense]
MVALIKYNWRIYLKSHKYILPIFILIINMVVTYTLRPIDITGTFIFSACLLFFVMAWMGYTYFDAEQNTSEEILILKSKNYTQYLLSKILMLQFFGVLLSLFSTIIGITCGGFLYPLTIVDIVSILIIHIVFSNIGVVFGMFFQPRIISNTKTSRLLIFLLIIVSIFKEQIVKEVVLSKFIIWILPPINMFTEIFLHLHHFSLIRLLVPIITMAVYTVFEAALLVTIMKKRLY